MRCSDSTTIDGLLSIRIWSCPAKSVTVTNRSSGWCCGKRTLPVKPFAIASNASSKRPEKTLPPKGGANHRARTNRDNLVATSSFASSATRRSIAPPLRRSIIQAIGIAQNFENRENGRASGSSNTSTSAFSSHKSVRGASDCPVTIAWARKTPLMPPALDPAMISVKMRNFVPARSSTLANRSR